MNIPLVKYGTHHLVGFTFKKLNGDNARAWVAEHFPEAEVKGYADNFCGCTMLTRDPTEINDRLGRLLVRLDDEDEVQAVYMMLNEGVTP